MFRYYSQFVKIGHRMLRAFSFIKRMENDRVHFKKENAVLHGKIYSHFDTDNVTNIA